MFYIQKYNDLYVKDALIKLEAEHLFCTKAALIIRKT